MGKLNGKVALITGGSTGMALAGAKLFVEEGWFMHPSLGRNSSQRCRERHSKRS